MNAAFSGTTLRKRVKGRVGQVRLFFVCLTAKGVEKFRPHNADEQLEQPVISHGLPLMKIHAHLIGVQRDFRVHISERLLDVICAH